MIYRGQEPPLAFEAEIHNHQEDERTQEETRPWSTEKPRKETEEKNRSRNSKLLSIQSWNSSGHGKAQEN